MEFFALSIDKIVIRYFLMMAAVIIGVFTGLYWLAGLALPIFLSAVLGVSFKRQQQPAKSSSLATVKGQKINRKQAA